VQQVIAHVRNQRAKHLEMLFDLIRQPSVSAHGTGVAECAELLCRQMQDGGIPAKIMPTSGQPLVYADLPGRPGATTTIMFYGHYDVQPPDPLDAWVSPPFEPTIRDGRIYARGAGDNKGQLMAHFLAVQAYLATKTPLPINVKFLFEGEEEIGSPNLVEWANANRELLRADAVITSDGPKHDSGVPQIFFGVRGLLYVELEARGANRDLHSGNKGGIAPNPAMQLCQLAASMKNADGTAAIAGFYDDVRRPTAYERELLARIPFDAAEVARDLGLRELARVGDLSDLEKLMFEPTVNIAGFHSGYGGPGSKTIIPSRAMMKMDMRLVADQDPDDIYRKFVAHVAKHAPDVRVHRMEGGCPPSKTSPELPVSKAVVRAVARAYGRDPVVLPTLGGSMPDYIFTQVMGLPSIGVPYANPDENNHSPNENLGVDDFYSGIETSVYILDTLGQGLKE
jgi:acetylornithine deacetylase/succinyl-diaminopimelate desuccinylase-like protein